MKKEKCNQIDELIDERRGEKTKFIILYGSFFLGNDILKTRCIFVQ